MTIGEYIEKYIFEHGLSKNKFANICKISPSYVTFLINGKHPITGKGITPSLEVFNKIAKGTGVTIDELLLAVNGAPVELLQNMSENANLVKLSDIKRHRIPLIGSVAGGEPIYDEETDLFIDGPTKATCAVRLRGESMAPTYLSGDIIYIREQPDVRDGQVAVVFMNEECTLKHVYHINNGLQLIADNPKFKPIIATYDEYEVIRILGVPCGYTRMYDNNA